MFPSPSSGLATEVVLQAECVVVSAPAETTPAETTLDDTSGVNAVMLVAVFEVMLAATPTIVTAVAADKFVPVIVTAVPPAIGPEAGLTDVIVGGPIGVTGFEAAEAAPVPTPFVAVTVQV